MVKTQLVRANGERVNLDYYFNAGSVFNVVADGVSDLSLRRADYNSIIKQEGYDALIRDIEEKHCRNERWRIKGDTVDDHRLMGAAWRRAGLPGCGRDTGWPPELQACDCCLHCRRRARPWKARITACMTLNEELQPAILRHLRSRSTSTQWYRSRGDTRNDTPPTWWKRASATFFKNLRSLDSGANGFLQGKPKRGATDSLRFVVNTTVGLGGLFDVATPAGLHHQDEDIGQTLAVWGWKKSRYLYVPFVGPSTVRDLPVLVVRGILPRLILGDFHNLGISGLDVVSARAGALDLTETRDAAALDAYVFTREAYVQRRKFLIFDGNPPVEDFDDFFDEFDEDDEFDTAE